jgi:AmmeMemoRadiSam system protein B
LSLKDPRTPVVAGSFYPADRQELSKLIVQTFLAKLGPGRYPKLVDSAPSSLECFIVPHAGYIYSGSVAAHSYLKAAELLGQSRRKLTVIIIGPNHYGIGSGLSLSPRESWVTPLGRLLVDTNLSLEISRKSNLATFDDISHSREYSIEVQLPYIQKVFEGAGPISIVPISVMLQDRETMVELGDGLYDCIKRTLSNTNRAFLVLGSSDLTHYESQEVANLKDLKLLSAVESMDISRYYTILERENVSACGYGPIASVMRLSEKLGMKQGKVLKYATSGDVIGDHSSVVGYSAVHFA